MGKNLNFSKFPQLHFQQDKLFLLYPLFADIFIDLHDPLNLKLRYLDNSLGDVVTKKSSSRQNICCKLILQVIIECIVLVWCFFIRLIGQNLHAAVFVKWSVSYVIFIYFSYSAFFWKDSLASEFWSVSLIPRIRFRRIKFTLLILFLCCPKLFWYEEYSFWGWILL